MKNKFHCQEMTNLGKLIWFCDGLEQTHACQMMMVGEWEVNSDRAGSMMKSGCCESQFPKNSYNVYQPAGESALQKHALKTAGSNEA